MLPGKIVGGFLALILLSSLRTRTVQVGWLDVFKTPYKPCSVHCGKASNNSFIVQTIVAMSLKTKSVVVVSVSIS